ncbi:hypothetical protein SCATT_36650 [Streptantibioticus cattleyicolor NRRL 8057 = DSM 46488]|uniref:Uncharacterized protein n=1 Tax=Streptantibioticus cattleyicolor (strain ATCC 35852 / DSM 46488 / JCM 4925 / NBRC 14057 / NRRL 8057) TaxID=1003195 RepID=G8X045_STREN|nr:hypothetical protein SCATT_36650 [Streptantibioticus cattleyicolor NRRL 8057 = DSM 46488]
MSSSSGHRIRLVGAAAAAAAVVTGVCAVPAAVAAPVPAASSGSHAAVKPVSAQEGTVTDTIGGLSSATAPLTPTRPVAFSLTVAADRDSHFTGTLSTRINFCPPVDPFTMPTVSLQAYENGTWVTVPATDGAYTWELPAIPAGMTTGDLHTYQLRFVEAASSAPRTGEMQANFAAFTDQDSRPVQLVGQAYGTVTLGRTAGR